MKKVKSPIILMIFILTILCFCSFIKKTEAADLTTGTYNWTTGTQGAITIPTGNNVVINVSGTITVTGKITVAQESTLTIKGTGTFIRGSGYKTSIFDIYDTGTLIIEGNSTTNRIIIDGNYGLEQTEESTLIRCDQNLTLKNVTLQSNYTDRYRDEEDEEDLTVNSEDTHAGGAITILNHDNEVNIDNCIIKDCKAYNGGAIYLCRLGTGTINITNTAISNCEATGTGGGAIFIDGKLKTGETVDIENIANYTLNISNVTIDGCKAKNGSAIYMHNRGSSKILMEDCTLKNCTASGGSCGTIRSDGNSNYQLTISGGEIYSNTSAGHGGGIYWNASGTNSKLIVKDNVEIYNNTATSQGGGLFVEGKNMDIQSANIYNNNAVMGGGIGIKTFADTSITGGNWSATDSFNLILGEGVTIKDNIASQQGGGLSFNIVDGIPVDGYTFNYTNAGAVFENNIVSSDGGTTIDGIGGGIAVINGTTTKTYNVKTTIESGVLTNNKAGEGGAVHITIGDFTMSGGTIEEHTISGNGGAVYVSGGSFTMSGGEIKNNSASNGVAYVSGGNFRMSGGDFSYNKATNGGAVYVNDGEATVTDGNISYNDAVDGGALYIVGGNFLMTSGNMTYNTASNEGGAVYANGGSIVIGIQNCTDENNLHEAPKTHPNVTENVAVYGGGGFMTDGELTMYCGVLRNNSSNNEGTGNNIYMNGGTLNLDGGTVGEETNPGVVLIGGELNDTREKEIVGEEIIMVYHSCLDSGEEHRVSVTEGKYVNLPAGQKGWVKEGHTMVGWTTVANAEVKAFDDYKSVGMAIKVDNADTNKEIHYYAVWAKTTSTITYNLDGGTLTGTNANSYKYSVISETLHLISPEKEYYNFIGWRLTASEETKTNWETYYPQGEKSVFYSVEDAESGLDLNIGTHFGDITLTAVYEIIVKDIQININNSMAKNQSYILNITGTPSIGNEFKPLKIATITDENGSSSVIIKGVPLGIYTVELQGNWSWRYSLSENNIQTATNLELDESQETHVVNFEEFDSKNQSWLNRYNFKNL